MMSGRSVEVEVGWKQGRASAINRIGTTCRSESLFFNNFFSPSVSSSLADCFQPIAVYVYAYVWSIRSKTMQRTQVENV